MEDVFCIIGKRLEQCNFKDSALKLKFEYIKNEVYRQSLLKILFVLSGEDRSELSKSDLAVLKECLLQNPKFDVDFVIRVYYLFLSGSYRTIKKSDSSKLVTYIENTCLKKSVKDININYGKILS